MIISHFQVIPYSIPFLKPLQTAGEIYSHREGFWLKIQSGKFTGFGEAAPLSGFSRETLREVHYALEGFHQAIDGENFESDELFSLIEAHSQNIPSVRFSLETAIYDILAKKAELPLAKYCNPNAKTKICVNGISGVHFPGDGYSVIKVKVGFRNLFDEIENMKYLTESFGNEMRFRLDANGVFDLPQAIRFCKEMGKFNIEYIEQPLPADNLEDLAELTYHTEIPIAVDESLTDFVSAEKIIDEQAAQILVIKPTVSGGFKECEKIIHLAQAENIRTVISSSLETFIGREACLHIVLSNEIAEVCGLATGCLLSEDKALSPILGGKIGISENPGLGIDFQ